MKEIAVAEIRGNLAEMIGRRWMLISSGVAKTEQVGMKGCATPDNKQFNTMTASWGFMGYYANRYCAMVLVRPERYTYEFIEKNDTFTLSFFPEKYRKALSLLGTRSGRDGDKITEAGLTSRFTPDGNPTFMEADLVIECRKIYSAMMQEDGFLDTTILDKWYGEGHGGLHKMYWGEIIKVWIV